MENKVGSFNGREGVVGRELAVQGREGRMHWGGVPVQAPRGRVRRLRTGGAGDQEILRIRKDLRGF